jgi:hypothetical protein
MAHSPAANGSGKGFFVENPKDLKGTLDEAMNFRGPALVNVVISRAPPANPGSAAGTADPLTPRVTCRIGPLSMGAAPSM